jgi:mevalonate kinase
VDAAAAERGGCLLFSRARGAAPVVLMRALDVVVARVERAPSTRAMVEAVRLRREADPAGVDSLFRQIEGLVHRATASLATGRLGELGPLLTHNQRLLGELGVSTPALDAACSVALSAGALGAKLTGAGGGGCLLAVTDPDQASGVCARLSAEGFESFVARVEPRSSEA